MLADELDYVVGVDTHRDRHAVAVVDAHTGAVIAETTTAADARGYADAVRFADRHALGDRLWAIEGAGHYGAGLCRYLQRHGEAVHQVERTSRLERRLRGKDDRLDAARAARSALASRQRATPRAGQHQEALRLLLLARRSASDTRRVALVQLRSVIITAPDELRSELRRLGPPVMEGVLLREPAGVKRAHAVDETGAHIEPAGPRSAAQVFVRAADREIRAELGEIERQHARVVVHIEQHQSPGGMRVVDEARQLVHHLAGAEHDSGEDDELSPAGESSRHGVMRSSMRPRSR